MACRVYLPRPGLPYFVINNCLSTKAWEKAHFFSIVRGYYHHNTTTDLRLNIVSLTKEKKSGF